MRRITDFINLNFNNKSKIFDDKNEIKDTQTLETESFHEEILSLVEQRKMVPPIDPMKKFVLRLKLYGCDKCKNFSNAFAYDECDCDHLYSDEYLSYLIKQGYTVEFKKI